MGGSMPSADDFMAAVGDVVECNNDQDAKRLMTFVAEAEQIVQRYHQAVDVLYRYRQAKIVNEAQAAMGDVTQEL